MTLPFVLSVWQLVDTASLRALVEHNVVTIVGNNIDVDLVLEDYLKLNLVVCNSERTLRKWLLVDLIQVKEQIAHSS